MNRSAFQVTRSAPIPTLTAHFGQGLKGKSTGGNHSLPAAVDLKIMDTSFPCYLRYVRPRQPGETSSSSYSSGSHHMQSRTGPLSTAAPPSMLSFSCCSIRSTMLPFLGHTSLLCHYLGGHSPSWALTMSQQYLGWMGGQTPHQIPVEKPQNPRTDR